MRSDSCAVVSVCFPLCGGLCVFSFVRRSLRIFPHVVISVFVLGVHWLEYGSALLGPVCQAPPESYGVEIKRFVLLSFVYVRDFP